MGKRTSDKTNQTSKKRKLNDEEELSVKKYRKNAEISVSDPKVTKDMDINTIFPPYQSFEVTQKEYHKSSKHLLKHLSNKFDKPTPIQAQAWPIMKEKRDFIGVAETGSGKTLAFCLPVMADICKSFYKASKNDNQKASRYSTCMPECLILAPTRELAIQSFNVVEELSKVKSKKYDFKVIPIVVYGGARRDKQQRNLHSNEALNSSNKVFVVATVGRLLDFVNSGDISLEKTKYLILDEADRMLDQGFEKEVRKIIVSTPKDRQTVMFSATWPQEIRKIAREFMKEPVKISIGSDDLSANKRVDQKVIVLEPRAKDRAISNLLMEMKVKKTKEKIIVFALYKKESSRVENFLQREGYKAVALNGDKSQRDREAALESFSTGSSNILVATDVASRGLDIRDVTTVINYTFPLTIEDYVHRIGRTGRAGKTGTSITFFTSHEKHLAGALQNILRENGVEVPEDLKKFGNTVKKKTHGMYGSHFKPTEDDGNTKSKHIKF